MRDLAALASHLRALHRGPDLLLLANAWDVASARAVEAAGFPAVATTSAGVAAAHGLPDADVLGPDTAFAAIARIAGAVTVPVTADLEAGYGLDPAAFVERLLDAGAVGCNLEDTDHHTPTDGGKGLVPLATQAERIAAVKDAGRSAGVDIVVNARTDAFARGLGSPTEQVETSIERGRAYLAAGADCVYPILARDEADLRSLVAGIGGPVNVYLRPGVPDLATLASIGVARASVGSGLFRVADRAVRGAAEALRHGDFSMLA